MLLFCFITNEFATNRAVLDKFRPHTVFRNYMRNINHTKLIVCDRMLFHNNIITMHRVLIVTT